MQLRFDMRDHTAVSASSISVTPAYKPKTEPPTERDGVRQTFAEINRLIGLDEVKTLFYEVYAYTTVQQRRKREQLKAEPTVLHAIFSGNPGSGKTTVARLMAKLYREMGVLSKGHLVEVERADLVGEFIGHTAQRTREQIRKSLGGVMFLDEAYSLTRGGEKDFGREAIDALVKGMEDHKNDFVLVLAGYRREMQEFLESNPGLRSRFPLHVDFADYSTEELLQIADCMYQERQYQPSEAAMRELERCLLHAKASLPAAVRGNARSVRNLVEASLRMQAVRLTESVTAAMQNKEMLCRIEAVDICSAARRLAQKRQEKCAAGEIIYMNHGEDKTAEEISIAYD